MLQTIELKTKRAAGTAGVPACYVVKEFDRASRGGGRRGRLRSQQQGDLLTPITTTVSLFPPIHSNWLTIRRILRSRDIHFLRIVLETLDLL